MAVAYLRLARLLHYCIDLYQAGRTCLLKQFTPLMGGSDDVKITRNVTFCLSFHRSPTRWILHPLPHLLLSSSVPFLRPDTRGFRSRRLPSRSRSLFGFEPNQKLVAIIAMISIGCALAAYGELLFGPFGFTCQVLAVTFESSRLVMIQVLLHGLKMDPLVSLYYYSPVRAIINARILPVTEGFEPFHAISRVGPFILAANVSVAFSLTVADVFLIGASSGLVSMLGRWLELSSAITAPFILTSA